MCLHLKCLLFSSSHPLKIYWKAWGEMDGSREGENRRDGGMCCCPLKGKEHLDSFSCTKTSQCQPLLLLVSDPRSFCFYSSCYHHLYCSVHFFQSYYYYFCNNNMNVIIFFVYFCHFDLGVALCCLVFPHITWGHLCQLAETQREGLDVRVTGIRLVQMLPKWMSRFLNLNVVPAQPSSCFDAVLFLYVKMFGLSGNIF